MLESVAYFGLVQEKATTLLAESAGVSAIVEALERRLPAGSIVCRAGVDALQADEPVPVAA